MLKQSPARISLATAAMLACFVVLPSPSTAETPEGSESAGKLEGTWVTQVTVRDCQTGSPLRTFVALNTFNEGHTMIDTTTTASASARAPGLGKWEKTGPQTYSATSLAFLFSPVGAWSGTQKLTHLIQASGGEITFKSTVEITDTAGNVTVRGCATAVGQKL